MKKTFEEFKAFIARGNIMDMAIGVIIGGAFGKIVSSLVDDIIMPIIGLIIGGVDFSNLFVTLDGQDFATAAEAKEAGAAAVMYGNFIQNIVNFLIIALVIFFLMKQITKVQEHFDDEEEPAPTTKVCPFCHTEIHIDAVRCPNCTSKLEVEK